MKVSVKFKLIIPINYSYVPDVDLHHTESEFITCKRYTL